MIPRLVALLVGFTAQLSASHAAETNANRLTYLDADDPFYVGVNFPRLTTPQWIGEPGVEAAVILSIDDMRDPQKYEAFLRPVLNRLKQIDGRAPLSILCNQLDPQNPQLQAWLQEGLSFEVHTLTHPCPLLANTNFVAAETNYHGCVDLLGQVPNSKPVAFRMPCCDSINSPSPRFYAEIFNRVSRAGHFLTIDSSVMNITTASDRSLPRELVMDADGRERFRKYFPPETNAITRLSLRWFGTTVEDYPYPYVIGRLCWEFPAVVPSDWEAYNLQGATNSVTVADWKAALDAAVLKQGTFALIFHPHGWIRPEQLVEFIDYAVQTHGRKVKFLNFRQAQDRLDENLLHGQPLRAVDGQDNGVRLLDLNNDGFMDVVIGNEHLRRTRIWSPKNANWVELDFPTTLVERNRQGEREDPGVKFGIARPDGRVIALVRNERLSGAWYFDDKQWVEDRSLLTGLELNGAPVFTRQAGSDRGVRLRNGDSDGRCDLIVSNDKQNGIFSWSIEEKAWKKLPYALPEGIAIVDEQGRDAGLRFIDLNEDGHDDVVFSNEHRYSVHLFIATPKPHLGWERGWTFTVSDGKRGDSDEIPMIVRGGTNRNNGAWFHGRHLWVQSEDTAHLPDKVERRSFTNLLTGGESPPKSPEQSLASIRLRTGFKAELVAHEPLVIDPVAFEWGPDGKFWVVEMRDYPLGMDGKGKPGGVIKYLQDTDGDGRYDKATVFLENLRFPTGVLPWRKGILVSAAPEIFYAEDTDGDGKADLRKTILAGFGEGNQQHRINGFEFGLDNWVYAANGGSSGKIRSTANGKTLDLRGHDLRFRPDTGEFELVAGQTQFGRRQDDWGNWFGNENPTWLWHYHLPERYLMRNPYLAVKTTRQVLANYPDATRVHPISRPQRRFNWPEALNHLTSANSATPYRDELFGTDFATSVFISEPAHNLVHREILETNGVTFTSHRAADEQDREFLASTDNWFRPTMLKTGPDGALYIADIYRLVIEHPEYFPDELKKRPDLRAGDDRGRIYRVYPVGARLRPVPQFDKPERTNLVYYLDSTNGWQRDTVRRLLIEAGDTSQPVITELLQVGANNSNPRVRLSVSSTFEGLGALTPNIAFYALGDYHPGVREFGIYLSERFLKPPDAGKENRALVEALLKLASDPSVRVRYQLALSSGEWEDPRAGQALARIALKDRDNPHVQTAVLSSSTRHVNTMLETVFSESKTNPPPVELVSSLMDLAAAFDKQEALAKAIEQIATPTDGRYAPWQPATLAGFLEALERRSASLKILDSKARPELKAALPKVGGIFAWARNVADQHRRSSDAGGRLDLLLAIRLLGRGLSDPAEDVERLSDLLRPQLENEIQATALTRLKRIDNVQIAKELVNRWNSFSPGLRIDALNLLLSRPEWTEELLAALQTGKMLPGEVAPVHQQQLTKHANKSVRERAQKLFSAGSVDRQKVLKTYERVGQLRGDPQKGGTLFRQHCVACHQLKGEGSNTGPDLGSVADKPVDTLLVAILDPNQAFESRYINFTAVTRDGREISGIIVAETPNSLTMRSTGGKDEIILRSDLKELTSSRLSLMPEGFESALKPQDMADLIAFLRTR